MMVFLCTFDAWYMMLPLLDGGRTANFKFEQTGIKICRTNNK